MKASGNGQVGRFRGIAAPLAALALLATAGGAVAGTPVDDGPMVTLEKFTDALEKGDRKAFDAVTTADFRSFENGGIYDRDAFYGAVRKAIGEGMRPDFRVTDERVTTGGTVAAINYINHGTYVAGGETREISWLEIVSLRKAAAGWQIDFLESQVRTPTPR